jgi:hypothetical protein
VAGSKARRRGRRAVPGALAIIALLFTGSSMLVGSRPAVLASGLAYPSAELAGPHATAPSASGTGSAGVRLYPAAEIDPSHCAPCHAVIAESKNPKLIFSHGFHLTVVCTDCHWRYPHTPTGTIRPSMQSCFNCHGIGHGLQGEMAKGACRTCHPPSVDLRPSWHGRGWSGAPHVRPAKQQPNLCALCHSQARCGACHAARHVKTKYVLAPYLPELPAAVPTASVTLRPEAPASRALCAPCHQDLDRFNTSGMEAGRIVFSHPSHSKRGFLCVACHRTSPHRPDGILPPRMRDCYACHGVTHASQGLIASAACATCHPKGFDLLPRAHRPASEWISSHGPKARADLGDCYMCHKMSLCVACHLGKTPLPAGTEAELRAAGAVEATGPQAGMVIPSDHRVQQWGAQHGKDFMNKIGSCSPCHAGGFCDRCHKTPMPHPPNWLTDHGTVAKGIGGADCNICHQDRSACQSCHHVTISEARLEQKTCVRCHPDAALDWHLIKDKGMIVHAVHWKKRYRCLQCHFGFAQELRARDMQHSYSFDLCRECHGALSVQRSVIATPSVGAALCRACHPNLAL